MRNEWLCGIDLRYLRHGENTTLRDRARCNDFQPKKKRPWALPFRVQFSVYLKGVTSLSVSFMRLWERFFGNYPGGQMSTGGGIWRKNTFTLYGTRRNLLGNLAACWKPKSFKAAKSAASRSQRLSC